jgi:hypothetical protein
LPSTKAVDALRLRNINQGGNHGLYDRRAEEVTLDEVERILV